MTDNVSQKNIKTTEEGEEEKEIKQEFKKGFAFINDSELIINHIIEKIISLVITNSFKNKIENKLPIYCFEGIKESLEILTNLDFLTHDKDDLEIKNKLSITKIKSATNLRKNKDSSIIKDIEDVKENNLQKSEIIRKYRLEKQLDINYNEECSLDMEVFDSPKNEKSIIKEKKYKQGESIVLGFLVREEFQDKTTSFQRQEAKRRKTLEKSNKKYNYNFKDDKDKIYKEIYSSENDPFQINAEEKIEMIKNVEVHKIDFFPPHPLNTEDHQNQKIMPIIPYDTAIDSINFWKQLSQPKPPSIDRNAGTKIKYEKLKLNINKRKQSVIPEDKINIEEQKNSNKTLETSPKKLKFNFPIKKEGNNKSKKKKYVQFEFDSTDIDPKNLETYMETNEIAELRLKVEKDIQEKKKELLRIAQKEKEKIAKQEEIEERRKELSKKNVTTDIKGELVFIKPIDMKALNEEFNKGRSNCKIIKTVETVANYLKNKKNLVVEKNPDMNIWDFKEEKNKKKPKKKKEYFLSKNSSGLSISPKKGEKNSSDKPETRYAAGSNFTIINPEVGVSIIEDKHMKTGGKDFYQKYNRFSIEVFQEQLNKTSRTSFFPALTEPTNTIDNVPEKLKKRASINVISPKKKKILKEIEPKIMEENLPHEENNTLSVKTKNLGIALQNLDLINEGTQRYLSHNKKIINKNFIKNALSKYGETKTDYKEMNVFAKTLMGTHNWGGELYSEKKKINHIRMPKKPEEIELQRELPASLLRHMPRKRLPPINSNFKLNDMGKTSMGFYTNRNQKKVKMIIDDIKKGIKTERDK